MTNQSVFNSANAPLYTHLTNTYANPGIESTPEAGAANSGILFTTGSGSVSVGGGSNLLLQVTNPPGSGVTLYISRIFGGTTAAATLTWTSGGTITGGTTPTPFNLRLGSAGTSGATVRYNTGSLGGTPTVISAVPLTAGLYELGFAGGIVVPPNQVLSITLGTGALTGSINITWWEL